MRRRVDSELHTVAGRGSSMISEVESRWTRERDEAYWQSLLGDDAVLDDVSAVAEEGSDEGERHRIGSDRVEHSAPGGNADPAGSGDLDQHWQTACRALETEEVLELVVTECNRGRLLVRLGGLNGFVPCSQLESLPRVMDPGERIQALQECAGRTLRLRVIEIDRDRGRLILSERAGRGTDSTDPLDRLTPGDICTGRVIQIRPFGAFVNLGGVEGLLHISELSWGWVSHPADMIRAGDDVKVYVIGVNREERKVALSLKRLTPDPWTLVNERYAVGDMVEGLITNVVSFGAFMQLEEGLEGLIHVSELAHGDFMHPRMVVTEGRMVTARVMNIDSTKRRLALSLRQGERGRPAGVVSSEDGDPEGWGRRPTELSDLDIEP